MISVIVPVYNAEAYIEDCVNSILSQTFQDFELILVNDGSQDHSLEFCKKYESDKVKVINKSNGGASSARNVGIEASRGDFLVFVDSDDTIPQTTLQSLIGNSTTEVDTVIGNFNHQYGEKIIEHKHTLKPGVYDYKELLPEFIDNGKLGGFLISSSCSTLYRSSIVKRAGIRFNEELRINEDGLFNLEYALHAGRVKMVEDVVYLTRKHNDSSRHTNFSKANFNKVLYDYLHDKYPEEWGKYNFENQFLRRKVTVALWDILVNVKVMNRKDSFAYLKELVSSSDIREALPSIKINQLPRHKKIMFLLIKGKNIFLIYIFAHYVIPFLSSKIAR